LSTSNVIGTPGFKAGGSITYGGNLSVLPAFPTASENDDCE
jgi:hypothetical protein